MTPENTRACTLTYTCIACSHMYTKGNDDSTRIVWMCCYCLPSDSSYGVLHNLLLSFYTSSIKCQLTTRKSVHLHVLKEMWATLRCLPRKSYFWRCASVCPKKSRRPLWKMWIYFTQDSEAARPLESIKLEELHFTLLQFYVAHRW